MALLVLIHSQGSSIGVIGAIVSQLLRRVVYQPTYTYHMSHTSGTHMITHRPVADLSYPHDAPSTVWIERCSMAAAAASRVPADIYDLTGRESGDTSCGTARRSNYQGLANASIKRANKKEHGEGLRVPEFSLNRV